LDVNEWLSTIVIHPGVEHRLRLSASLQMPTLLRCSSNFIACGLPFIRQILGLHHQKYGGLSRKAGLATDTG